MISFTDAARTKVAEFIAGAGTECAGLRLRAMKVGKYTFRYQIFLARSEDVLPDDVKVEEQGFDVYLDPQTAEWMQGATLDFLTTDTGSGFSINNPASEPSWDDPLAQRVQQVIDREVLPALGSHGGWVELDRVDGDTAYVRLGGGCQGCSSASFTVSQGIEAVITREVPEIAHVVDATDHSEGQAPYYSS
jgi:Fe/S biogenesis protein NfuA